MWQLAIDVNLLRNELPQYFVIEVLEFCLKFQPNNEIREFICDA